MDKLIYVRYAINKHSAIVVAVRSTTMLMLLVFSLEIMRNNEPSVRQFNVGNGNQGFHSQMHFNSIQLMVGNDDGMSE